MNDFLLTKEIHVVEAYGRSYNELHEARTAWHNNRSGRYINRSDAERYSPNATITWVDRYGHELGVLA
jgi:hypothetical protein